MSLPQSNVLNELRRDPEKTLNRVFKKNRPDLRRLVASRLDQKLIGRVDPSDIVQETLFEACRRLGEYLANPSVPFLKWLMALAEQNTVTAYRRHMLTQKRSIAREEKLDPTDQSAQQHSKLSDKANDQIDDPKVQFERSERFLQLQRAIGMLPPRSQQIVRLRFLENRSLAEIARNLDLSVDAVSKRALRSLVKLSQFAGELGLVDSANSLGSRTTTP